MDLLGSAYTTALTQLQVTTFTAVASAGSMQGAPHETLSGYCFAVLQATNTLPTNFTTSHFADLADVEAEILQVLANTVCCA